MEELDGESKEWENGREAGLNYTSVYLALFAYLPKILHKSNQHSCAGAFDFFFSLQQS